MEDKFSLNLSVCCRRFHSLYHREVYMRILAVVSSNHVDYRNITRNPSVKQKDIGRINDETGMFNDFPLRRRRKNIRKRTFRENKNENVRYKNFDCIARILLMLYPAYSSHLSSLRISLVFVPTVFELVSNA